MRILFATRHLPPPFGGMENWLLSLIGELRDRHEIGLFAPGLGPEPERDRMLAAAGVSRVFSPPRSGAASDRARGRMVRDFAAIVEHFLPDRVHATQAGLSFLVDAVRSRIPFVVSTHATDLTRTRLWEDDDVPTRRARLASYLRRVSAVTAVSRFTRDLARGLGAPEPIRLIPPAVDTERFSPGDVASARRRLGIPRGAGVVLSVGRLVPRKGHARVLRQLAAERDLDWRYVVAGIGPEREPLESLARELGVRDRLLTLGEVDDAVLPDVYRAADVFALPVVDREDAAGLDCEGFGIVFLEAAATGIPVVAGRAGGIEDAVACGETGVLVGPRDDARLGSVLRELLRDPRARRRMGTAGRRRVLAGFARSRLAAEYEALYDAVSPEHPSADASSVGSGLEPSRAEEGVRGAWRESFTSS